MKRLEMIRTLSAEEMACMLADHQVRAMKIACDVKHFPATKQLLLNNEDALRLGLQQFLVKWLGEDEDGE